jgi:ubiquinone/menaquinone biosynthesis C-methylase UbiE
MARLNTFDRIAPVYDLLTRIVFGSAMKNAQVHFFDQLSHRAKVLIIGGGTGWIARELLIRKPLALITYIDASDKMISKAKTLLSGFNTVRFIHGTENDIPEGQVYDVVVTNFYFDLFSDRLLLENVTFIGRHLSADGKWLVTDFVDHNKRWQKAMLSVMYRFFQITASLATSSLPDWRRCMLKKGFREIGSKEFYGSFIRSSVFKKLSAFNE